MTKDKDTLVTLIKQAIVNQQEFLLSGDGKEISIFTLLLDARKQFTDQALNEYLMLAAREIGLTTSRSSARLLMGLNDDQSANYITEALAGDKINKIDSAFASQQLCKFLSKVKISAVASLLEFFPYEKNNVILPSL